LPAAAGGLAEAVTQLPGGTLEGKNDWHRTGYGGPCPPIGRHRYFFKLFALDRLLGDLHRPTSAQLQRAFGGHVSAEAQLIGLYAKER
jgi:hypothetical protein